MRFFTSDHHFGHGNIMRYQPNTRRFSSVKDMDEHMVAKWNKVVGVSDMVYVVGDFSFYRDVEKIKNILSRLNGKKILIRGNHDLATSKELIDAGFTDVRDELLIKLSNGRGVLLKHYPYDGAWYTKLYHIAKGSKWKKYYLLFPNRRDSWLIHGHHHGGQKIIGKQINVNVDSWDFKPISESTVCQLINNKENNFLRRMRNEIRYFIRGVVGKLYRSYKGERHPIHK